MMSRTLRSLMLLGTLLLPLMPLLASKERQERIYILDDVVYLDVNAGLEMGVWEAIEVLQQALEQRAPAWAQYRWQDSKGREHTLAEYFWDVSGAQRIGVNPRVLLVTAGMALDWQIPAGKDLRRAISEVGVALNEHYLAFRFDEDLRARYPQVVNAASYALYAFFGYDLEQLEAWKQTYQSLFVRDALILAATPTPNATPGRVATADTKGWITPPAETIRP